MLEHVILRLKNQGFMDLVINIHHFGQQIIDFLEAKDCFDIHIAVSDERDEVLETGGGILKASDLLDDGEPFLVHNADILTNLDLQQLYHDHKESGADATLLVGQRDTSRYLIFDPNHRLCGWTNKTTGEVKPQGFVYQPDYHQPWAFGGIHVISPSLLHKMKGDGWSGKFSIIPFYLSVCQSALIMAHPIPSSCYWFDIGKHETLEQAEKFLEVSSFKQ